MVLAVQGSGNKRMATWQANDAVAKQAAAMRLIERGSRIPVLLGSVFALLSLNTFQNVLLLGDVFVAPSTNSSLAMPMDIPTVTVPSAARADQDTGRITDIPPQSALLSSGLLLCRREQLLTGRWLPVTLDAPPYVSRTVHLRCPIVGYDYENPGPWQSWDWAPTDDSCHFTAWNAEEFCDLLPFATVSVIGDSLSWEQYSSLVQLVGGKVHQTHQHVSRLEDRNIVQGACGGNQRGTKFVFRNDARLTPAMVMDSIDTDFPNVLVLNRGAHFVNDTLLAAEMQSLFPILSVWQAKCDRLELKCHLFWRTSAPGHVSCGNFSSRVNDVAIMESHIESRANYNETTWKYHWQDFSRQNELVLQLLQGYSIATGLRYEVIDAYALNVLRPDGHRWHQDDCLHNCYPGKMDVYNQLLLHFLKMQRSPADSQRLIQLFERFRAERVANQTTQ